MIESSRPQTIAYLDSNVFIYALEGEQLVAEPLQRMFSALRRCAGAFVTSELTLAEVLAPNKIRGAVPAPLRRKYMNLIVWNSSVQLQPVSRGVLYETAELRKRTGQKLPDAIHSVTAIQSQCRFLMSGDRGMKKLPPWMTLLDTDFTGVDSFIEAAGV